MAKRDDNRGGVTADVGEARRNRKLQLIVNNSFPGERGLTLLEQMEKKLDQTVMERNQNDSGNDGGLQPSAAGPFHGSNAASAKPPTELPSAGARQTMNASDKLACIHQLQSLSPEEIAASLSSHLIAR